MKWKNITASYADRIREMEKLAPHQLLGIDEQASAKEVKAAYLRLVKAYHPDRSDPFMARYNQEVTKLINVAYKRLTADR